MSFVFASCRAGSETAMKKDVASWHGGLLTPAFMRPQLITWKTAESVDASFIVESPFARVSGLSIGISKSLPDLVEKVRAQNLRSLCLHTFPRVTDEDGITPAIWQRIDTRHAEIASALTDAGISVKSTAPIRGDVVLDAILDEEPDASIFLGLHRHQDASHSQPGGLPRIVLPSHAPSRAWLKVEQALIWRGWDQIDFTGQTALDLGCAPGGASLALLDRGMRVSGVDTGDMDESVLRHDSGSFRHIRCPLAHLDPSKVPQAPALLLCDINLAPPHVLPHLERLQQAIHAKKLILTLKLNSADLEACLDDYVQHIRSFAPGTVHVTQLAANRREVCVTAG